jgi:hypothetical protein
VEHFLIILLLWPRRQENGLKTIGIIRGDELEQNQFKFYLIICAKLRYAVGVYFKRRLQAQNEESFE